MSAQQAMAHTVSRAWADTIAKRNQGYQMLAQSVTRDLAYEHRTLRFVADKPARYHEKLRRIARLEDLIRCCARAQSGDDLAARNVAAFRTEAGL